jgi:endogenous inhibitor of DNA gyrase (YacG/DUF329 family)
MIDLGKWLNAEYVISDPILPHDIITDDILPDDVDDRLDDDPTSMI